MKTSEYSIPVPGKFRDGAAFLDLETRKVPAATPPSDGFRMKNGELLRRRWSAFLAGVAVNGEVRLVEYVDDENDFLASVREAIGPATSVVYGATREFDEMILKGRFTNARRAHELVPFYPSLPGADDLEWVNLGPKASHFPELREADTPSKGVSKVYETDPDIVLIHNLRDVAELILAAGEPDADAATWCVSVLSSTEYAANQIFGGE